MIGSGIFLSITLAHLSVRLVCKIVLLSACSESLEYACLWMQGTVCILIALSRDPFSVMREDGRVGVEQTHRYKLSIPLIVFCLAICRQWEGDMKNPRLLPNL